MVSLVENNYALFIVADGLGGHSEGAKASNYFCRGMVSNLFQFLPLMKMKPKPAMSKWVDAAVNEMAVLFNGDEAGEKAHTTCAILYMDDLRVVAAHCGDSRVYKLNQNELIWRSKDHSMIQKLYDEGKITAKEMGSHPEQNRLTRSINIAKRHKVDVKIYPSIKEEETFLLCTDGFWGYIKEAELLKLAQPDAQKENLRKLANLAVFRAAGASDNVTVQLIKGKAPS